MAIPNEIHGLRIYSYVQNLLAQGLSPDKILADLIEKGVDPQEAAALIGRIVAHARMQQIRELAKPLVSKKTEAEEIERQLTLQGFDQQTVALVVKELVEERNRTLQDEKEDVGPLYRILGIVAVITGVLLIAGNQSGLFPTFPFAGAITMFIGVTLLVFGKRLGRH